MALATFFYTASLIIRLPGIAIRYYYRRSRALGLFKNEMIAHGIPPGDAEKISGGYPFRLSDIVRMLR